MEQSRRYIPEYIDELREKGLSEWTVHSYAYALRSAFHCEIGDLGIELKTRSRADVVRNRDAQDSALRNDERYEKVVTLAKATGARRMEFLRLRREDFRERTDCNGNKTGELEVFKRGKNGIERWCLVDPKYNDFVRELIATAPTYHFNGEDRLLRKADSDRQAEVFKQWIDENATEYLSEDEIKGLKEHISAMVAGVDELNTQDYYMH